MNKELPSTSELLVTINNHKGEKISLGEFVDTFREGGFSLLLIVFCAPLALPLPALGIAQIMALPILLLSLQLMTGRKALWLPQKMRRKEIKLATLRLVIDKILPWLKKLEHIIKPRIRLLSTRAGHQFTGLVCVICSLSIAVPVPFSNTVPSMGIVIMSIGLLERDGLVIKAGMLVGLAGVALAISVYYLGLEAIKGLVY